MQKREEKNIDVRHMHQENACVLNRSKENKKSPKIIIYFMLHNRHADGQKIEESAPKKQNCCIFNSIQEKIPLPLNLTDGQTKEQKTTHVNFNIQSLEVLMNTFIFIYFMLRCLFVLDSHERYVTSCAFSVHNFIFVTTSENICKVWRLDFRSTTHQQNTFQRQVNYF